MSEIVITKKEILDAIENINQSNENLTQENELLLGEKAIQELRGKKKKVAICGFAPYSLSETPWNNEEFEFWGLNELYMGTPNKFTRWFEMHHRSIIERTTRDHNHLEWMQKAKIPIYMQEHYEDIPYSVRYPKEEVFKQFRPYFTNSISWMIAIAIMEEFEEIHIYGVDMAVEGEYSWERPSCEYFLGVAEGRGIRVYIPRQSDLLKAQYLYGYQDQQPAMDKADARLLDMNRQLEGLHRRVDETRMLIYSGLDRIPADQNKTFLVLKTEKLESLEPEKKKIVQEVLLSEKEQESFVVAPVQTMRDLIIQEKRLLLDLESAEKVQAKLNGAVENTNYHKRIWNTNCNF